jgi:broad specificity phosphatase PhoE
MNRLYWVRHGETQANIEKIFSFKCADYALTPKGRLQALQTAKYFLDKDIHEIYSSPARRSRETAGIIAISLNMRVNLLEEFREVNIGEFDGLPMEGERIALHRSILSDWFAGKPDARFPAGEDYRQLWVRMQSGYEKVFRDKKNKNVVIVGHGGGFKYTLKSLCHNSDPKALYGVDIPNCSITELIVHCEKGTIEGELVSLASYAHLSGPASDLIPGLPKSTHPL